MDTILSEVNKQFINMATRQGFYSEALVDAIAEKGTLRGIKEIPLRIKKLFRTAHEIPYTDHIEMQACFQKYTDNAVSKTINFPAHAKREDIANAYILAYDKSCKGITIFRYGVRKGTLMRIPDVD